MSRSRFEQRIARLEQLLRPKRDVMRDVLRAIDGTTRCLPSEWMANRRAIVALVQRRLGQVDHAN